jgi:primary-amine oxidase
MKVFYNCFCTFFLLLAFVAQLSAAGENSSARMVHGAAMGPVHPLDPLTAEEINDLRGIVETQGGLGSNTIYWAQLHEPPKDEVLLFKPGMKMRRRAEVIAISPSRAGSFEFLADLQARQIETTNVLGNLQPALTNPEFDQVPGIINKSAEVRAALEKRHYHVNGNISDRFYLDVYAPGQDKSLVNDGKTTRAIRVLFADRQGGVNSYGPYVEGLMALVNVFSQQVILPLQDVPGTVAHTFVPEDIFDPQVMAPKYLEAKLHARPSTSSHLKLEGDHVQWEKWDFRLGFNLREGLVIHQISYLDQGRLRSICYRAAVSEMLVPYSDPSPGWVWREFFDEGEYGLGYSSSEVNAGKELPDNAETLSVVLPDEKLHVSEKPNRIFLYERDGGALFAHRQSEHGARIYARGKELVVGFVATVGNYDYIYKWVFREDASFAFEAELEGLILNKTIGDSVCRVCAAEFASGPGVYETTNDQEFGTLVSPQIDGVFHQHWINLRMDFDIDGPNNAIEECDTAALPFDQTANSRGRAFTLRRTVFGREREAERNCDSSSNRVWVVYNPGVKSPLGHFSGYEIQPEGNTISALPDSRFGQDCSFTQRHLWATQYHPNELYAAGKYPNQAREDSKDNLFYYAADNENIYGTDIVIWYSLGFTHITKPEDYPIMPAARVSVNFAPHGFFPRSPALGYANIEKRDAK